MSIRFYLLLVILIFGQNNRLCSQDFKVTPTPAEIIAMTPEWKGERFPDGRPKTDDRLLERLKNISMEEAWGSLRNLGFHNQFESDWIIIHPENVLVGRVVTAQYMPLRPDFNNLIKSRGESEGRIGGTNSWPIDVLKPGDVYVADGYGKIINGTLIGDNLGNAIYRNSKNGVIFYGSVRDLAGLEKIDGFNGWIKGHDPSFIQDMMLESINQPVRIGRAAVLPGDVVLAKSTGVIFIPAQHLEEVVIRSEFIALRDQFGHQRLREGKYTPGEIDRQWTDNIRKDFLNWISENEANLPMSRAELDAYMKDRTW